MELHKQTGKKLLKKTVSSIGHRGKMNKTGKDETISNLMDKTAASNIAEIENKLITFITDPEATNKFANKIFLKHLIADNLKIPYSDLTGLERTDLYEFTKKRLKIFKKEPTQKSLVAIKKYLHTNIQCRLAEIRKARKGKELAKMNERNAEKVEVIDLEDDMANNIPPTLMNNQDDDDDDESEDAVSVATASPQPKNLVIDTDDSMEVPHSEVAMEIEEIVVEDEIPPSTQVISDLQIAITPPPGPSESVVQRKKRVKNDARCIKDMVAPKMRREYALKLKATPHIARERKYQLVPENFQLTAEKDLTVPYTKLVGNELGLEELSCWSEVSFVLNFMGLEITRSTVLNTRRELLKRSVDFETPRSNVMTLHRVYNNQQMKELSQPDKEVELSHEGILLYLQLMLKVLDISEHPKAADHKLILNLFMRDLKKLPRSFLGVSYGYFLNEQQYYRRFVPSGEDNKCDLVLHEIINPEVIFTVSRCPISDEDALITFFMPLLEEKNPQALLNFNLLLTKGILIKCHECGHSVTGSMSVYLFQEHLKGFCAVPWKCTNCLEEKSELVYAKQKWTHSCSDATKENSAINESAD